MRQLWSNLPRRRRLQIGFALLATIGLAVFGILHYLSTAQARSAGELAGVFAWAKHKGCGGRPSPDAIRALESHRVGNPNAYNAGFIEGSAKLENVYKGIGVYETCKLFVFPYRDGTVIGLSIGAGLWLPSIPEPAWERYSTAASTPRPTTNHNASMIVDLDQGLSPPAMRYLNVPEATCLSAVRRYQKEGPHNLDYLDFPDIEGKQVSGRVVRIACVGPAGRKTETHPERAEAEHRAMCAEEPWKHMPELCDDRYYRVEKVKPPPVQEKKPPATANVAMGTHGWMRRAPGGKAIAPFAVKTSSGGSYFVKLVGPSDNRELIAAFIVGGQPFSTTVPAGSYELRYAVGQQWVNEQEYFGPSTSFFKADRLLEFSVEGDRVRWTEVELILQLGGNLRTSTIPRGSF